MAGTAAVKEMRPQIGNDIPVIVMSVRQDIDAHLSAVRAGTDAYFVKPVNVVELADTIHTLLDRETPADYRVLIIDDDQLTAEFYATLLTGAGMVSEILNNPLEALDRIQAFIPDLILMDIHMPGCSGVELAAVVRQDKRYTGLPIVFLSTEVEIGQQQAALNRGGGDFLTKPVDPEQFVHIVNHRIRRSQTLRRLASRDSMTGLLIMPLRLNSSAYPWSEPNVRRSPWYLQ